MRPIRTAGKPWKPRRGYPRLQAARDRIAQLDRDAAAHGDRAERAEAWLNKIHGEMQQQFPQGGRKAT
jgi:hypothetical protein